MVQPIILTPPYGAWPMGHATEAYMFAKVMSSLVGDGPGGPMHDQLHLLARRISDNRVIAGVHFPIDSPAGYFLADRLADAFVARCSNVQQPVSIAGGELMGTQLANVDADPALVFKDQGPWAKAKQAAPAQLTRQVQVTPSPLMAQMWQRSRKELTDHGWL